MKLDSIKILTTNIEILQQSFNLGSAVASKGLVQNMSEVLLHL